MSLLSVTYVLVLCCINDEVKIYIYIYIYISPRDSIGKAAVTTRPTLPHNRELDATDATDAAAAAGMPACTSLIVVVLYKQL